MSSIKEMRRVLENKLRDNVNTSDNFKFIEELDDFNEFLYVADDDKTYHMLIIKTYEDNYSVKYSIKQEKEVMNIDQEFIENVDEVVDYINDKISDVDKKIG